MSALSLPLPALPALDNSYGALLLGTFAGLMLYGVSLHQLYRYVRLYPRDKPFIRFLVIATMVLETTHTAMTMHFCYVYLVKNFLNPIALTAGIWSLQLHPLLTGLIMVFAQIFFARRLYLVGPKYKAVVLVAIVFLAGEFGFAAAATIQVFTDKSQEAFYNSVWLVSVCLGMATVADTLLTGAFIVVLRRSRTGFKGTDSVLDMLVIYAINTGLVTGVFNILSFSLAAAYPRTFIEGAFNIVTARLYANTFLAVLNSRKLMFTHGVEIFDKVPMGHNIFARANRMATAEQWNVPQLPELLEPPVISIKVTTETEGSNTFGANSVDSELTKPLELTERMGDVGRKP